MSVEEAMAWMKPYPAEEMAAYAVRPAVNTARNESVACIAPAD